MGYHRISMEEFHHQIKDPKLFGHQIWFHPHGWYFGRAELPQCSSCVCLRQILQNCDEIWEKKDWSTINFWHHRFYNWPLIISSWLCHIPLVPIYSKYTPITSPYVGWQYPIVCPSPYVPILSSLSPSTFQKKHDNNCHRNIHDDDDHHHHHHPHYAPNIWPSSAHPPAISRS